MKKHSLIRKLRRARQNVLAQALAVTAFVSCSAFAAQVDLSSTKEEKQARWDRTDYTYSTLNDTLRLQVTGTMTVGYNDNVDRTHSDKIDSAYLQPGLQFTLNYFPSPDFYITANGGIAYKYWTNNDVDSEFLVFGDLGQIATSIQGTLKLGQTGDLVIGDDIMRTEDPLDSQSSKSNGDSYTTTTNATYLRYTNWMNEVTYGTANYTHTIGWTSPSEYKYEDYQSDTFDFSLMYGGVAKDLYVGPYATYVKRYYSDSLDIGGGESIQRNDSDAFHFGLAYNYEIERTIFIEGRAGYTYINFAEDNNSDLGLDLPTDDASTPSYNIQITYLRSERVSHTLYSSYDVSENNRTWEVNYAKQWEVGYSYNNKFADRWSANGSVIFRNVNESDKGDNYNIIRPAVSVTYDLTPAASITARYEHTARMDSDQSTSNYDQNVISCTFAYRF